MDSHPNQKLPFAPPPSRVSGLREVILFDRYARKVPDRHDFLTHHQDKNKLRVICNISDTDVPSLHMGDLVRYRPDKQTCIVNVHLLNGETKNNMVFPLSKIDIPAEQTLQEIQDRMIEGILVAEEDRHIQNALRKKYTWLLQDFRFVPAGRIWAGLGGDEGRTLYNCYFFPIEPQGGPTPSIGRDSREAILHTLEKMVETMSRGGGVGLNLGVLRPRGGYVEGVAGRSSGAVSWGELYSFSTGLISQGGSRRGAGLLILPIWHPDIEAFIKAKQTPDILTNVNLSVDITKEFEKAVRQDDDWDLIFPDFDQVDKEIYNIEWTGSLKQWIEAGYPVKVYKTVKARDLFNQIVESAWACGEPGIIRLDHINEMSNSWYCSEIYGSNPCGEQPLPAYGVCNLGHINLSRFVMSPGASSLQEAWEQGWEMDWDSLEKAIRLAVRFLDTVIDVNQDHIDEVHELQRNERRIGLGTMGLAELLIRLGYTYGSDECLRFVHELYGFIRRVAYQTSTALAKQKGSFPAFSSKFLESKFAKDLPDSVRFPIRTDGIRNMTILTQAPTGTVGTMAGTSTGIEPFFQFSYSRSGRFGSEIEVIESIYQEYETIIGDPLTEEYKNPAFITAMDIDPDKHIKMQATIQRYVDASVSKTINLPSDCSLSDAATIYQQAIDAGCKGVTIYRDRSRSEQVLNVTSSSSAEEPADTSAATPEDPKQDAAPNASPLLKRSEVVKGYTERVKTPVGKIYVTTNFQDDQVVEVLLKGPDQKTLPGEAKHHVVPRDHHEKVTTEIGSLMKAMGILISELLKWGASPERIARQLSMAIGNPFYHFDPSKNSGVHLTGISSAISHCMFDAIETAAKERQEIAKASGPKNKDVPPPAVITKVMTKAETDKVLDHPCPICGTYMIYTDCWYCRGCGHSKCE